MELILEMPVATIGWRTFVAQAIIENRTIVGYSRDRWMLPGGFSVDIDYLRNLANRAGETLEVKIVQQVWK